MDVIKYNRKFNKHPRRSKSVSTNANMVEFLGNLLNSISIGKHGWYINKATKSSNELDKFDYFDYIDTYCRLGLKDRFNSYDAKFAKNVIKLRRIKMYKSYKSKV